MNRSTFISLLTLAGFVMNASAANTPPVVATPLADQTIYQNAGALIDLTNAFSDPDTRAVRFSTVLGDFTVELFSQAKPRTVTNFLQYVDQGRYFKTDPTTHHRASSFIHRSVSGFVIQGGGFIDTVFPSDPTQAQPTGVAAFPAIQNEPGISNTRGTIAMAKLGNDPNSATSQWFINLADNSANLDHQDGGFTVFGRVVGSGMMVVDKIAAVPVYHLDNGDFTSTPLINYTPAPPKGPAVSNFVTIPGLIDVPPFTFTASSSDAAVATVSVNPDSRGVTVTGRKIGTATITVTATDYDGAAVSQHFNVNIVASPGRLGNIATRLQVQSDPNELIAGFILSRNSPKRVLIRGIGPSLIASRLSNALPDPTLELRDHTGKLLVANDDWADANRQAIIDTGIAPTSGSESAILATLPANKASYTAILRGVQTPNGVGLVEVYDLDTAPGSAIANLSTRGFVQTGDNVMIGGFIISGTTPLKVIVRAIGPSLSSAGISNPLSDPMLELHDAQGAKIAENNNWRTNANAAEIQASGLAPTNPRESALLQTLPPGGYTAIVSGLGPTPTGVGLVEAYSLP